MTRLRAVLNESRLAGVIEILIVFGGAALVILLGISFAGENLFARQLVIVAANITMLTLVWLSLRMRGQNLRSLGLSWQWAGLKPLLLATGKSLVVFVLGLGGFMLGAVVMVNISGMPQQADVSAYNYLQGNLPLFLLSLVSIYVFSSFGEEVVYRGYLITRLEDLFGGGRNALIYAIIISSVVFGLAHYGWGLTGVVQTTFMGAALAICYLWFNRNLWLLVAAHAYMDTLLIVPLYFGQP